MVKTPLASMLGQAAGPIGPVKAPSGKSVAFKGAKLPPVAKKAPIPGVAPPTQPVPVAKKGGFPFQKKSSGIVND